MENNKLKEEYNLIKEDADALNVNDDEKCIFVNVKDEPTHLPQINASLENGESLTSFQTKLDNVLTGLFLFLSAKNKNYGNSALAPVRVFSKAEPEDGILQRMDDKLSRIKNSDVLRKNDIVDLMGYLAILCINKEWTDFTDLID